jgi:hypothetical protein
MLPVSCRGCNSRRGPPRVCIASPSARAETQGGSARKHSNRIAGTRPFPKTCPACGAHQCGRSGAAGRGWPAISACTISQAGQQHHRLFLAHGLKVADGSIRATAEPLGKIRLLALSLWAFFLRDPIGLMEFGTWVPLALLGVGGFGLLPRVGAMVGPNGRRSGCPASRVYPRCLQRMWPCGISILLP